MFLSVQWAERGHLRAFMKSHRLDCRGKNPTSVLHKLIHSSIKQSPTVTYRQQRDGEGVTFHVTFTTRSHIGNKKEVLIHLNCNKILHGAPLTVNCSEFHSATDSTHGIVIFRDTWGYFQTLMWWLKSAIPHNKSDHFELWSWRPKASYKDWKGPDYLLMLYRRTLM